MKTGVATRALALCTVVLERVVLKERGARGQCAHSPVAEGLKDALPGHPGPRPLKTTQGVWDSPWDLELVGKGQESQTLGLAPD